VEESGVEVYEYNEEEVEHITMETPEEEEEEVLWGN